MITIFVKYSQFRFVCEFGLENARNAVLELQKCENVVGEDPPDHPFLCKLSLTVEINQKRLYYNYYTSNKFLTLKFKFQIKSLPPQLQVLHYVPAPMMNMYVKN